MHFGKKINYLAEVDSTNNEAGRHMDSAIEGSVWVSSNQTKGRGQQHNSWESEPGMNLTFSLLLRPVFLRAESQFLLSKIISLGVSDFLIAKGLPATIKWPNDIYVGDKKITGILIENHILGEYISISIAGIGININQEVFTSNAPNPTSFFIETKRSLNLDASLKEVLSHIEKRYTDLADGRASTINIDYLNRLYRFNEWSYYIHNGRKIRAKIVGIHDTGELSLTNEIGDFFSVAFKEIAFCL